MFRNRMLADPSFSFKVGTEMVIDSCSATIAEVQKRGKDFWDEFELYAADFLVGIVVDIALVGLLAPYARFGKKYVASGGLFSGLRNSVAALPSSVFEFERPGSKFSAQQRIATYFYKGLLYGSVGFGCGLVCQGFANMIMNAKRDEKRRKHCPVLRSEILLVGYEGDSRCSWKQGLVYLPKTYCKILSKPTASPATKSVGYTTPISEARGSRAVGNLEGKTDTPYNLPILDDELFTQCAPYNLPILDDVNETPTWSSVQETFWTMDAAFHISCEF